MKILLVSPYHGGSHQSWAEGYKQFSVHDIRLLSLPARFWKWRMHGGAVTLARRFREMIDSDHWIPDLILATDMLDLSTFLTLVRRHISTVPIVLYMHENQLTYPLPEETLAGPMRRQKGERDLHYAFINYSSMVCADRILFNSHYHRNTYFGALPNFLKHFPDNNELDSVGNLRSKSGVLPVGINLKSFGEVAREGELSAESLILWNQRWEYDKNPSQFFDALYKLAEDRTPFRLAVCGQNYRNQPEEFVEASHRLAPQIVHFGYADEQQYHRLLWQADITISTAYHEFFGISILEAIACQTFPILPSKLSYPEIIPDEYHDRCLYGSDRELNNHLRWALENREKTKKIARQLATHARIYEWPLVATLYDDYFNNIPPSLPV